MIPQLKWIVGSVVSAVTLFSTLSPLAAEPVVKVDTVPQQQMIYGMDFERLWHWGLAPEEAKKLARQAVAECHVDYVRVAIDGGAEFEEGQFNWDSYKMQLQCMTLMKEANPNIKFFASPRPFHEAIKDKFGGKSVQGQNAPYTCFPLWIGVFDNPYGSGKKGDKRKFVEFKWEKAADYMVRQIRFLESKGFKISYFDVKNENDRYYKPAELNKMVDRMRQQMGDKMPQVIAASSWSWGDCLNWLNLAKQGNNLEFFDILSAHNTGKSNELENLQKLGQYAKELKKPLWNTELHGFEGPDDIAVERSMILWRHIRAGFGGINDWLSLGNEKKVHKMFRNIDGKLETMRVYYMFKQLVNTSAGGSYLQSDVPEELSITAAFIKDKTLTVWLLNTKETEVKNVKVDMTGHNIASNNINVIWWGPDNPREGSTGTLKSSVDSTFSYNIKGKSLYCFTVSLK